MSDRARLLSYQRDARQKRKKDFDALKEGRPCMDCGKHYPPICMDFDHRDPQQKSFNISGSKYQIGWSALLAEIAKCDLVCANCHRIRTAPMHEARVALRGRPKMTNGQKTHCPAGHAYDVQNTGFNVGRGGTKVTRRCKACDVVKAQKKRDKDAVHTAPVLAFLRFVCASVPGKCSKGHVRSKANSYVYKTPIGANARICRICVKEKESRRKRRVAA